MTQHLRVRALINGHVQGVGFRFFTMQAASRNSIRGFVRNLNDGSVEVVAGGSAGSVALFLDQLRVGPPLSRVDGCEVQPLAAEFELREFSVR